MNVPLEPEEQKKLVELAHLGEWLINAHHDSDFQDEAAMAVIQKLYAAAKDTQGIDRDVETGDFYMSTEWTDRLFDKNIVDYDDHVFWDELTERLAQRDLARERGVALDEINRDDDVRSLRPLEEKYREELEEHGIERIEIKEDF